ncbi:MAG: nickel pincer cofactor biosynthesis protein LarB [bacterium]|nr:nickel pincer cofactor biosynthesis protein LarB [bacterium]
MHPTSVRRLLADVAGGRVSVEAAVRRLRHLPYETIGHSTIDRHRALRQGFPEVIFCEGKTVQEIEEIAARICATGENILATRASEEAYLKLRALFPDARYHARARVVTIRRRRGRRARGSVAVVSAGTADGPVAEEAAITAEMMGVRVRRLYDVGVAGLHRLIGRLPELGRARAIVVVAGMEGALPSVVGGLVGRPVIAVPTSVGYGASFGGLAALLGMLTSCAAGVTVVNIDNGFGAGYAAAVIARGT